jgi:signal transduction histidine kinase
MAERPTGRGLANMQARAAALGGSFSCAPRPGGGTIVSLWLPCERSTHSGPGLPAAAE